MKIRFYLSFIAKTMKMDYFSSIPMSDIKASLLGVATQCSMRGLVQSMKWYAFNFKTVNNDLIKHLVLMSNRILLILILVK